MPSLPITRLCSTPIGLRPSPCKLLVVWCCLIVLSIILSSWSPRIHSTTLLSFGIHLLCAIDLCVHQFCRHGSQRSRSSLRSLFVVLSIGALHAPTSSRPPPFFLHILARLSAFPLLVTSLFVTCVIRVINQVGLIIYILLYLVHCV